MNNDGRDAIQGANRAYSTHPTRFPLLDGAKANVLAALDAGQKAGGDIRGQQSPRSWW